MTINYYPNNTSSTLYFSSSGNEINIREEFSAMFDGVYPENSKCMQGVLRRARRDSDGNTIPCQCIDPTTNEPDRSNFCYSCHNIGYLFDDEYILFYKVLLDKSFNAVRKNNYEQVGIFDTPFMAFYFKYDSDITLQDYIIELTLDTEGNPIIPIKYKEMYRIDKPFDYRLDNGKLEYWKVFTHKAVHKFLNIPVFGKAK